MEKMTDFTKSNSLVVAIQSILCIIVVALMLYWNSLLRSEIKSLQELKYAATKGYLVKIVLHNDSPHELTFKEQNLNYFNYPDVNQCLMIN